MNRQDCFPDEPLSQYEGHSVAMLGCIAKALNKRIELVETLTDYSHACANRVAELN